MPAELPPNETLVITVAGNLYFAAVPLLEERLPRPVPGSSRSVVVLRLRNNHYLGSTGIRFLRDYARSLEAAGGKLLLAGVSPPVHRQLVRTGEVTWLEPVFEAEDTVFASTRRALAWAGDWLGQQEGDERDLCALKA